MRRLRLGWDVGGWHCDRNRASRDALAAFENKECGLCLVGTPWRGNLRDTLVAHTRSRLIREVLARCNIKDVGSAEITIAIDTPLGWPSAMLSLAAGGSAVNVPDDDSANPYTRRLTEMVLKGKLRNPATMPLSAVRDMIGSQSTKGIHFLRAAGLVPTGVGVWRGALEGVEITAIETYPAAALAVAGIAEWHHRIVSSAFQTEVIEGRLNGDVSDAIACAIVAHLFADHAQGLETPPPNVPPAEGWIFLPRPKGVAA